MNKIVYIKAPFKATGRNVTVNVPTGETKKGLFGEKQVTTKQTLWEQTGWSDCEIDGELFSQKIAEAVNALNLDGYEVTTVLPIISGNYDYRFQAEGIRSERRVFSETEKVSGGASFGYGYGYSFTEGVTIFAKKQA